MARVASDGALAGGGLSCLWKASLRLPPQKESDELKKPKETLLSL